MNTKTLPIIHRARGWRLYGLDGSRYLDLCSDGGKTLLGRKNGGMETLAKACIDRGIVSEFTSVWTGRFQKALKDWLPGCDRMYLFPTSVEARAALSASGALLAPAAPRVEMAFGEYRLENGGRSRPEKKDAPALVELPLPALWSFGIVATTPGSENGIVEGLGKAQADSAGIPAIKMALATKALAELAAFKTWYSEDHWARMDPFLSNLFTRSGPWLYPAYDESEHGRVFGECLSKGMLISPHYAQPSLVPGEFDSGEVSGLKTIDGRAKEA